MAETRAVLVNTKMSIREEATEGTAIAETANDAILLHSDGAEFNLERELVENSFMTGSLSRTAPQAGMWSDDLGPTIPTLMRGAGTLSAPDWSVLMKSIFGTQNGNSDGVCDTGCTTTVIQVKSGAGDLADGQLIYFPTQGEIRQVTDETGVAVTIRPALSATPSEDDTFQAGINWQLSSSDHPSFTAYSYFDGPKRLRYAGCKCIKWEATFEVGQNVPMIFTTRALSPTYDNTAQAITPVYDTVTVPLMCLGLDMYTRLSAVITGTPTTTETVLVAPDFDVAVGDSIEVDVGSSVYETVVISAVSGNAGSNITLTHAALSVAGTATETAYVHRIACATVGDTLGVTVEVESEFEKCMQATYGKSGQSFVSRTVTLAKTPYFKSWQSFLMRDSVKGSMFQVTLGDTANNIVSLLIPNQIIAEAALTTDMLMKIDVNARAVVETTLGNDHEIVIASF